MSTNDRKLARQLAEGLKLSPSRALEAVMKAQLLSAIAEAVKRSGATHQQIAELTGIPRSAVTGILAGSLQKVSLGRLLRIMDAVGLTAELKIRSAA